MLLERSLGAARPRWARPMPIPISIFTCIGTHQCHLQQGKLLSPDGQPSISSTTGFGGPGRTALPLADLSRSKPPAIFSAEQRVTWRPGTGRPTSSRDAFFAAIAVKLGIVSERNE